MSTTRYAAIRSDGIGVDFYDGEHRVAVVEFPTDRFGRPIDPKGYDRMAMRLKLVDWVLTGQLPGIEPAHA